MIKPIKKVPPLIIGQTSVIGNNDPEPFELQQQPHFPSDCEDYGGLRTYYTFLSKFIFKFTFLDMD